jgi:hypothetical protein
VNWYKTSKTLNIPDTLKSDLSDIAKKMSNLDLSELNNEQYSPSYFVEYINPYSGKNKSVSIYPTTEGGSYHLGGFEDYIFIDLSEVNNYESIYLHLLHEISHSIDPKNSEKLKEQTDKYNRFINNENINKKDRAIVYYNSLHEIDAHSSELDHIIKSNNNSEFKSRILSFIKSPWGKVSIEGIKSIIPKEFSILFDFFFFLFNYGTEENKRRVKGRIFNSLKGNDELVKNNI